MSDPKMEGKKILVVEDEAPLRGALRDALHSEGFIVLEASNGQEGLDLALKEKPAVLLVDLMMPVMDGMTMLKQLREDAEYGATAPVIVLSNIGVLDERASKGVNAANPAFYLMKANWAIADVVGKVKTVILNVERKAAEKK